MEIKDAIERTREDAGDALTNLRRRREARVEDFKVKVRLFSKKEARVERVNRALFTGMTILEAVMFMRMIEQLMQDKNTNRETTIAAMGLLAAAILVSIGCMIWLRKSEKFRYVILTCFLIPYALIAVFSSSVAPVFFVVTALPAIVLYYDRRCAALYTSIMIGIDLVRICVLAAQGNRVEIEEINTLIILVIYTATLVRVTGLIKRFDHDALHTLMDEQKMQAVMMDDILSTSSAVQQGTGAVADIVERLQNSTNVVHNSLKEIALSTQLTAENVQEQTVMTQQIQDAISETQSLSGNMVELAENSGNTVKSSMDTMKLMKQQAEEINRQNAEVFSSMQKLQEKTKEVQEIAGIIFSISSQTNLLALNASIESARAGEAGRGFAVVAEQIRQLSEQTRQSTENIARIIEELNANAKSAAETVDASIEASAEQNRMIDAAAESFGEISKDMGQLTEHIGFIDQKIGSLVKANDTIVENISQLSATSEEVTASSQEAEESSEENNRNAEQATLLLNEVLETVKILEKYKKQEKE